MCNRTSLVVLFPIALRFRNILFIIMIGFSGSIIKGDTTKYNQNYPYDIITSIEELTAKANAGDRVAMFNLGFRYTRGKDIVGNPRLAVEWYKKAAIAGHSRAQFFYALELNTGTNIQQDPEESIRWMLKAAKGGDADAMLWLSTNLLTAKEKFYWLVQASKAGEPIASMLVGLTYEGGDKELEIAENPQEALKWYESALRQGDRKNALDAIRSLKNEEFARKAEVRKPKQGDGNQLPSQNDVSILVEYAKQLLDAKRKAPKPVSNGDPQYNAIINRANREAIRPYLNQFNDFCSKFVDVYGVTALRRVAAERGISTLLPDLENKPKSKSEDALESETQSQGGVPRGVIDGVVVGVGGGTIQAVDFEISQVKIKYRPPAPPYPSLAKIEKIQGTVIVQIVFGPDGIPTSAMAIEGPPQLRSTAEIYAMQFKFEPAMLNGMPQYARVKLTMPFRLGGNSAAVKENMAAVNNDEPARIVNKASPEFPQRAVQMGKANEDRTVRLKVFVGEQGQPLKVSVVEGVSGSWGYDEAAIDAANKSTYSPATRDGKPIQGWTPEITFSFPKRR